MKNIKALRYFIIAIMLNLIFSYSSAENINKSHSRDRLFNSGWKFIRDSVQGAEKPEYDDSGWMAVDLPHDYSIMNLPGEDSQ